MSLTDLARARADAAGFPHSCSAGTAALLSRLVSELPEGARVGEAGSGYGVAAAAIAEALPVRATLVTLERDPVRARAARDLLAGDARVSVVTVTDQTLADFAPFDLVFLDAGPKPHPEKVLGLLRPGGVAVIDDFTPSEDPDHPMFEGRPDEARLAYRDHPDLAYDEQQVSGREAVVVLTRLPPRSR